MTNQHLREQMAQYAKDQRDMLSEFGTLMVNALKISRMALEEVNKPLALLGKVSERPVSTVKRLVTASHFLDGVHWQDRPKGRAALESLKRDNYGN